VLSYVFYLGITYIGYWLVWTYVFVFPVVALLTLLRLDKGVVVVKALGCYVLVSLVAVMTLAHIESNPSIANLILLPIIGGATLLLTFAKGMYDNREEAFRTDDYEILQGTRHDELFIVCSLALFVVALFVPSIGINPLTRLLSRIIDWAYNLKVIGWVLRIGGVLFMLSVAWYGFLGVGILVASLVGRIRGSRHDESEMMDEQ